MVRVPFFSPGKDNGNGGGQETTLPLRPAPSTQTQPVSVTIHQLPTNDGIIIKVTPPKEPDAGNALDGSAAAVATSSAAAGPPKHVPCDIVLVIDVSGSMAEDAPVPTVEGETPEHNGLSVLDLVKHASRTILETLDEGDRLGIVTFATGVNVLQELTPMTPENKTKTNGKIESMVPEDSTNLWQGMLTGISLFKDKTDSGRVPAIMVLTDGMPNFMSPAQGYIPKMRTIGPIPAPIHTFGFGYHLRSGLLKSIAEFTGGNYAFIPDAGMIGTVFVHAVANMQSTFATNASLRLTYPLSLTLEQTLGATVGLRKPASNEQIQQLAISLGSIQYGQSRDVYLRYAMGTDAGDHVVVTADLEYGQMTADVYQAATWCDLTGGLRSKDAHAALEKLDSPALTPGEAAFHISRSLLCDFLSSTAPCDATDEHVALPFTVATGETLAALIAKLPAAAPEHAGDAACAALMVDLKGQVHMALSQNKFYNRWGKHYLPSLQCAHAAQQCNSFKDPGPLLYGAASPLFIACRNALDTAFDTLPPPKPSKTKSPVVGHPRARRIASSLGGISRSHGSGAGRTPNFSMSSYHNSSGPCFASFCRVTLADGRHVRVNRLRRGMRVQTPRGPRAVAVVLKTPVSGVPMVPIGRLLITAWHPVSHDGARWVFPCQDPSARKNTTVRYTGSIYSVLLQPDRDADAHAVSIEGVWVVTLGHGLTEKEEQPQQDGVEDDVRVHRFFGDYAAVCRSLATLDVRKDGLVVNGGSARSNFRLWHTRK